ncbi:MAG: hypothetical protein PHI53_02995 [Candidatus Pacebacteria bacterium]|nr:hypothetical protein [Candidatus Paceibacterota bacterium]
MYPNKTVKEPEKTRKKNDGVELSNKNAQLNIKEIEEMVAERLAEILVQQLEWQREQDQEKTKNKYEAQ